MKLTDNKLYSVVYKLINLKDIISLSERKLSKDLNFLNKAINKTYRLIYINIFCPALDSKLLFTNREIKEINKIYNRYDRYQVCQSESYFNKKYELDIEIINGYDKGIRITLLDKSNRKTTQHLVTSYNLYTI